MPPFPQRSASSPTQQPRPKHAADTRENKSLEWHKQNFMNQQKSWQAKHKIRAPTLPRSRLPRMDKPLPFRRQKTDDRGTLRIVNPDAASVRQPSMDQWPSHVVAGSVEMAGLASKSRSMNSSIRRKPLSSETRDELFFNHHPASPHAPTLLSAERTPSSSVSSDVPASLVAGRGRAASTYSSAVGDAGLLGIPLSVYDFRGSLPASLQPKEPPLRWDVDPAPQLPPIVPSVTPNLCEDVDLAKFMTTDKSDLQPFKETMPVATTIVKGNLGKFVAK